MKTIRIAGLSILVLACTIAGIIGLGIFRHSAELERWLKVNGPAAEDYAIAVLNGNDVTVPNTLTNFYIQSGKEYVSFCTPAGPQYSEGMAYSLDGQMPTKGLGGEPRVIVWRHVDGNWFEWMAD